MEPIKKKIYVTQPSLPELKDFITYLEDIWESKWLTNKGIHPQQFEQKIKEFLGVEQVNHLSNGILALFDAFQALRIAGEVIVAPYSFVATTHALHLNGIKNFFYKH